MALCVQETRLYPQRSGKSAGWYRGVVLYHFSIWLVAALRIISSSLAHVCSRLMSVVAESASFRSGDLPDLCLNSSAHLELDLSCIVLGSRNRSSPRSSCAADLLSVREEYDLWLAGVLTEPSRRRRRRCSRRSSNERLAGLAQPLRRHSVSEGGLPTTQRGLAPLPRRHSTESAPPAPDPELLRASLADYRQGLLA